MKKQDLPRGLRNNNPGNIRLSKDKWQGLSKEQTDKAFFQFVSMEYGYRALIRILQNYRNKNGSKTIADFINRWAPTNENNTSSYIRSVCTYMQVPTSFVPDVTDKTTMVLLAEAISQHENGVKAVRLQVEKGWELL